MSNRKSDCRYIVVGAGIAGFAAARAIRERDATGPLALVSAEDRLPYKRTKISKNLAAGFARDAFAIEEEAWYRDAGIDLLVGESVVSIDTERHRSVLGSGKEIGWERLILATGASPILPTQSPQPGSDLHVVRTAAEVEELERAIEPMGEAVVVGSGVLAVEVAEQLRRLEKEVLLVGSGTRLLARHLNEDLSEMLESLLAEHQVEVVKNERITAIDRNADGKLVVAGGGGKYTGDFVVVCAGVQPKVELAREAGLSVGRGVLVDEYLRTSHPDVYAAGDVAEHPGGYLSFLWHAAELQGEIAGANAAGDSMRHDCRPFRLKCEVFGSYFFSMNPVNNADGHELVTEHEGRRYRCLSYRDGALDGVLMANDKERAKAYVRATREGWSTKQVAQLLPWRQ